MASRPIQFKNLYRILSSPRIKDVYVTLERRRGAFIHNYGEIPAYINQADGDPWDIIIPGYPRMDVDRPIRLKKLVGVYTLPNGNHKLIVDVYSSIKRDSEKFDRDIKTFKRKYEKHTKLTGSIIYF